jgi:hypothetical protein
MFPIFYSNIYNRFTLPDVKLYGPLQLKINNTFLSIHESKNLVDLFIFDNECGKQKWIIEKDGDYFYIRTAFNRWDSAKYLGSPNQNNQVFLYTTKNRFTRWNIKHIDNDEYSIDYTGDKFDYKDINIVISRYNENLDWVLPYNDISIIYNKGDNNIPYFSNKFDIQNIGREGHTYLYHILNQYCHLSNRTIFLQADWFPHNETILYGIDNYDKHLPVQPMGLVYLRDKAIPPLHIEQKFTKYTHYGFKYMTLNVTGDQDYAGESYFLDTGVKNNILNYKLENPKTSMISIFDSFLYYSKFPRQLNPLTTTCVPFTFCALFSVRKEDIWLYNHEVYLNITKELLRLNRQGGMNGYVLERLWLWLFQYRE